MNKKENLLHAYFVSECTQQKAFAKKIGVSATTLHNIINNKTIPSLKVAYEIEKATHGKVPAHSWLQK